MLEAEMAFITSIEELVEEVELLIKGVTRQIIDKGASDWQSMGIPEPPWLNQRFGCLTYDEAFNVLNNCAKQLKCPVKYGEAFSKEHELFLVRYNDGVPIFIINWPKNNKPFYMKECIDDPSKVSQYFKYM